MRRAISAIDQQEITPPHSSSLTKHDLPETGDTVWFDIDDDPTERQPRTDPPQELLAAYRSFGAGVHGAEKMAVDDATRERLSELGYLE